MNSEVLATALAYSFLLKILVIGFFMIVTVSVLSWLNDLFTGGASGRYKELFVDMYVVGKVKKFAEEDDIDLNKELKDFQKIEKVKNLSTRGLSSVVEEQLKKRVSKETEEKVSKENKK